jgi:hypothetical protein
MVQENRIGFVGEEIDRGNGEQGEALPPDVCRRESGIVLFKGDGEPGPLSTVLPPIQSGQIKREEFLREGEILLEQPA